MNCQKDYSSIVIKGQAVTFPSKGSVYLFVFYLIENVKIKKTEM